MDRLRQIRDFFNGKLSKEEAEKFLQWYMSSDSEEEVHAEIDKLWHKKTKEDYEWDGSDLFKNIRRKKDNARSLNITKQEAAVNTKKEGFAWFRIAAVISFVIITSIVVREYVTSDILGRKGSVSQEVVKSNPSGQKSKVYLPDGTIVTLNSESSLTYMDDFSEGRTVNLEGEAFFDVRKDTIRPFTVHSGRLSTTALGTSFNINSYDADHTEVVLVTGRIKVADSQTSEILILDPGEMVSVVGTEDRFEKSEADILSHTYWKNGILHFNQTDIPAVISTLERWYGVRITTDGKIPKDKCTGTFERNEYLSNVLDILSHSVGFEYTLNDKEVKLIFN